MGQAAANVQRLADLAKSPGRRAEMVHHVADLFLAAPESFTSADAQQIGDILALGLPALDPGERGGLAERMSLVASAPRGLMRKLAEDEVDVADPVLMQSDALTDRDLVEITETCSISHARAICLRESLSAVVTDALVATGDPEVLECLAENTGADFSRRAFAIMARACDELPAMQLPLLDRDDLPVDLMARMYFFVSPLLRERVLLSVAGLSSERFDAVLSGLGREDRIDLPPHLMARWGDAPVTADTVVRALAKGDADRFVLGLAQFSGLGVTTMEQILSSDAPDVLALVARGTQMDCVNFCALMALLSGNRTVDRTRAAEWADLYHTVPRGVSARMVRLWRVSAQDETDAAL